MGHKEIVNVDARYEDGQTALHIALQHGDPELMCQLIDHEGDLCAEDEDQVWKIYGAYCHMCILGIQYLGVTYTTISVDTLGSRHASLCI